jgi:flagellar biosynthesis chaperone FliJ
MQRFRFTLESVRHWRQEQAEIEESALGKLVAQRQSLLDRMERLQCDRREGDAALVRCATVLAQELAALESGRQWIKTETARLILRVRETDKQIEQQRARVVQARRNYELLQRLKERALHKWQQEADRELDQLAADVFLSQWRPES